MRALSASTVAARLAVASAVALVAIAGTAARAQAQGAQGRYQLGSKAFVGAPFVLAIVVDGLEQDPQPKLPSLTVPGLTIAPGDADFRGGFNVTVNGRRVQQGGGTCTDIAKAAGQSVETGERLLTLA